MRGASPSLLLARQRSRQDTVGHARRELEIGFFFRSPIFYIYTAYIYPLPSNSNLDSNAAGCPNTPMPMRLVHWFRFRADSPLNSAIGHPDFPDADASRLLRLYEITTIKIAIGYSRLVFPVSSQFSSFQAGRCVRLLWHQPCARLACCLRVQRAHCTNN